jgi:hypothetical protein
VFNVPTFITDLLSPMFLCFLYQYQYIYINHKRSHPIGNHNSKVEVSNVPNICPKEYQCPLSLEIMEDPVMLVQSGQTYDRKHLLIALAHHRGVDPVTQIKFSEKPQLCINYALKSLIEKYKAQSVSSASPVVVDNQNRCPPTKTPQAQKDTSLIVPFTVMHPYATHIHHHLTLLITFSLSL